MKAQECLMILRSLLRDDNYQNTFFNDGILLDYLSRAQDSIISQFKENIQHIKQEIKPNSDITFKTPIAHVFFLLFNNVKLNISSPSHALMHKTLCFYHKNGSTYAIANNHEGGELEITASFFAPFLDTPDTELVLAQNYHQAIALEAFCDILLIQNSATNPQKREYYLKALNDEKNRLRGLHNMSNTTTVFFTKAEI